MKRILADVSKWSLFQHRDARGLPAAAETDGVVRRFEDEVFERLYSGETEALPDAAVDSAHAAWARRFHDAAAQVPAFERLAADVRGDAIGAALAVETIVAAINPVEDEKKAKDPKASKPGRPAPGSVEAIRAALAGATQKAGKVVAAAREVIEGVEGVDVVPPGTGWDLSSGARSGTLNVASVRAAMATVNSNRKLQRIAALAGRFKRIAAAKRHSRVRHGVDELTDVEQGADLGRLLPSELAKLSHPLLRLAFLRDLTERRALQYRLEGKEPAGKGPLVVLVDKSSSMDGRPDEWASAVALALLERAKIEKRAFALIPFDSHPMPATVVEAGGTIPMTSILQPANGGTDIGAAVRAGLDVIEARPGTAMAKADLILITDGSSGLSEAPALRERAAALKVSVYGVGIGVAKDVLAPWADEAIEVATTETLDDRLAEGLFGAGAEAP